MVNSIRQFLRLESASGIILLGAAAIALILSNSPLQHWYEALLQISAGIFVGDLKLVKPILLWINDGLMAIFFMLVGLEIKREVLEGQLSKPSQIILPTVAALGGMFIPALIYAAFNWNDPKTLQGWAIPSATDIAFSLGILALLGKRVPLSLKLFLSTLAIMDDLGAIIIIALFYAHAELSILALSLAGIAIMVLMLLNYRGVTNIASYMIVGFLLWVFVLESGVHATLAGVLVALMIPLYDQKKEFSPLRHLEHSLHPWVAFGIIPIFAFANAGVSLTGVSLSSLLMPVPLGIMLGLFIGKQLGIFSLTWLSIKLGFAELPKGATWLQVYGVALLGGIGFTMSLFIGSLAFTEHGDISHLSEVRLGILIGTFLSAITGYLILRFSNNPQSH